MTRLRLNVSGTTFEIDPECLQKVSSHRLPALVLNRKKNLDEETIEIDRPAESFAAILAYYQTGELHIPTGVCPGAFRRELEHWDIGADKLAECCIFRYFAFFSEQKTLEKFCHTVLRDQNKDDSYNSFRKRIWDIIENNESSLWAKLYFCGIFLLVLLSIFVLAYGTEPAFRRKLTKCELIEYYEYSGNDDLEKIQKYLGYPDCTKAEIDDYVPFDDEPDSYFYYSYYDDIDYIITTSQDLDYNNTVPTEASSTVAPDLDNIDIHVPSSSPPSAPKKQKIRIPTFMIQNRSFDVLEKVTLALFTLDFLLHIFTCPSIHKYFLSIINIVDFLALIGAYVHVIVVSVEKEQRYLDNWLDISLYFQFLRTFRLFRVAKNVTAAKVLVYSVRQSLRDLSILMMFLLIAVCTFASIVYLAEDRTEFKSIPTGWWWAIVTLTTLGYGDICPKTGIGRVIGSLCAISGVILVALTLPIFVNNFLLLYRYADVDETLKKTKRIKQNLTRRDASNSKNGQKCDFDEEKLKRKK